MKLTNRQRNGVYIALGLLNAVLIALSQQGDLSAAYAHYVALASLIVASVMKQYGAPEDVQ